MNIEGMGIISNVITLISVVTLVRKDRGFLVQTPYLFGINVYSGTFGNILPKPEFPNMSSIQRIPGIKGNLHHNCITTEHHNITPFTVKHGNTGNIVYFRV